MPSCFILKESFTYYNIKKHAKHNFITYYNFYLLVLTWLSIQTSPKYSLQVSPCYRHVINIKIAELSLHMLFYCSHWLGNWETWTKIMWTPIIWIKTVGWYYFIFTTPTVRKQWRNQNIWLIIIRNFSFKNFRQINTIPINLELTFHQF